MEPTCPKCHITVRPTDYFCFNCGVNLRPAPPSMTVESQIMLYLGSFFLPPLGVYWGWKYLKSADMKVRIVGYVACLLTLIALIIFTVWAKNIMDSVNKQVNQIQNLQGY